MHWDWWESSVIPRKMTSSYPWGASLLSSEKESRVQTDSSELCSIGCWGKWGVHEKPPEHSNHLRSLRKPSCSGSSPDPFPQSLREEMHVWMCWDISQDLFTRPSTNTFMPRAPAPASGRPLELAANMATTAPALWSSLAHEEDRC